MRIDDIWSRSRERPFRPFRIHTADNRRFEIVHPDAIRMSKHRVTVAVYDRDGRPEKDMPADSIFLSPSEVVALEDVWTPPV